MFCFAECCTRRRRRDRRKKRGLGHTLTLAMARTRPGRHVTRGCIGPHISRISVHQEFKLLGSLSHREGVAKVVVRAMTRR